ncbi:hypothetical protein B0H13DRAFT_2509355 [Mycena leptocephala]|nr:hypothetical protein B0H13DRAFT_2509355 [Mycena leptocephala]
MSLLALSKSVFSDDRTAIFGPVLIGNSLNWLLVGLLVIQLNTYYRRFPWDRPLIRSIVCAAFFLDVAQTMMLTYHGWWLWSILEPIWGPMMPENVFKSSTIIALACWSTQLVAVLVQLFYVWRIWSHSPNKFFCAIPLVITFLALARGLNAITHALEILGFGRHSSDYFSDTIQRLLRTEIPIWSAGGLLPDTLILISMVYIMLQSESDLSLGSKAMAPIFTMAQIAAFPLICAYLDFVLVIYFPSTNYHFVPDLRSNTSSSSSASWTLLP